MLSVGGSGARSRSKSPGRRDDRDRDRERDRSRQRDMRAPSPARRASSPVGAPVSSRSKSYYDDDEDEDLLSDDDDRHRDHSRAVQVIKPRDYDSRRRYSDEYSEDDDDRRPSTKYVAPREYDRSRDPRREEPRREEPRREEPSRPKEYAIPGQFDDDDDRNYGRNEKGSAYSQASAGHNRADSTSNNPRGGYQNLPQFQYAQIDPRELKYVNKSGTGYTRTPSESGPPVSRNPPPAQVTIESKRHGRGNSYDDRADKYRTEPDRYKADPRYKSDRQKEYERAEEIKKQQAQLSKEREALALIEQQKRELDHLKKEREERESELRQKPAKTVTIRDDRDYRDSSSRGKRTDKYEEDKYRKGERSSRRYKDDESEDSDDHQKLEQLYHDRHKDQRDDRYDDRRDDRRRDKYNGRGGRESPEKQPRAQFVEIHPGGRSSALGGPPSPGLSAKTHRLSVSSSLAPAGALTLAAPGMAGHHRSGSFGAPPGSPLLESYKGTYQTISPMPSPMALAHHPDDSDLSDFELHGGSKGRSHRHADDDSEDDSDVDPSERKPKSILKRHREIGSPYDPEHDAVALATEMKRNQPSPELLIKILPTLRNDSISSLRTEYKRHAKIQGKGINIAKHIKLKLGSTNVGKAAYATALGRWESEAHWANFWYQTGSSRRELLIEALFGRSNAEIKAIKEAFSDKRYGDSLTRCMEAELKKDKFRVAVLKVLEAKRGEEGDEIDKRLVRKDVAELHKALVSKEGGETAMISIIVVRSDEHLRYILREYEAEYGENFARKMIGKSQNLVGETLAHILNGVLNRPVRDALLLRQAIAETSKDRAELIISRLVRFHWEPRHLERIKVEYRKRYGVELQHDILEGTKGDFSTYCIGLCHGAIR